MARLIERVAETTSLFFPLCSVEKQTEGVEAFRHANTRALSWECWNMSRINEDNPNDETVCTCSLKHMLRLYVPEVAQTVFCILRAEPTPSSAHSLLNM